MVSDSRSFNLNPECPATPACGPRLWRLVLGIACMLAAAALLVSHLQALWWWEGATPSGVGFVCGLMMIVGVALSSQAMHSDLFRLHAACIQVDGIQLHWSHAPTLAGPLLTVQRFLRWDEVTSVEWGEGRQDHDLRQLLQLTLHQPLIRHRHHLQLTVSEGRNAERCNALMALLPASTTRPAWMPRVQHLQNTRYVTD